MRELESLLLRAFLLQDSDSEELHVDARTAGAARPAPQPFPADFKHAKAQALAEFEKTYLRQLLLRARGNISLAARLSHKDRSALNKLVKKHGISTNDFRQSQTG